MHAVFAIEPEAIDNWKDLKYALEKFGYSKGLLIARFPKPWPRLVIEACERSGVGDVERARIVEKLRQAQNDRLVRMGLPFDGDDWIANAKQDGVRERLSAILVRDKHDAERFHSLAEVEEALFENRRDVQVKRSDKALAEAARYVLLSSDRVVLVDPYFEAKPRCCKVLQAMIKLCREHGHQLSEVVVYTSKGTPRRHASHDVADYERLLSGDLAQDIKLRIYMLSAEGLDQDFHARYLLSQRAGLRFDRGFVEPEDHTQRDHLTDVACLDESRVAELNSRYLGDEDDLADAESIVLPLR